MLQGRWTEALVQYETARRDLGLELEPYQPSVSGWVGRNLLWALALVKANRLGEALDLLLPGLERSRRILGDDHQTTARLRGAVGYWRLAGRNPKQITARREPHERSHGWSWYRNRQYPQR